ncbi:MAG: hypothetical protein DHS20C01_12770 [marine bacterium B5-7]|nr:MAG: hypothetical protein DHS20C01_12770 [marine bacterium B5-7]
MLSYIYRLCRDFEDRMGYPANVLLINAEHLDKLRESFGPDLDFADIRSRLGLEILLREDAIHPSVNWLVIASRQAG